MEDPIKPETNPEPAPIRTRKLVGHHHLSFYRGYLEGLELRNLADRYLEPGLDLRVVNSTLRWIRNELIVGARRQGRPSAGRLISLPPGAIPQTGGAQTLEDFREENDPRGFYSEREILELFQAQQGDDPAALRKAQRNARLLKKQRDALVWFERLATYPNPSDPASAWLDENVAKRLASAGLHTLQDVISAINTGHRWWTKVPKLGEKGALKLVSWLRQHQATVGAINARVLVPRRTHSSETLLATRPQQTAIAPLECFVAPPALDGSAGTNRLPGRSALAARNDLEAIHAFLKTRRPGHTRRSYQKEIERFLLWCILERKKAMSSLSVEDCTAYRDFISGPIPAQWIGTSGVERWSPHWRPFKSSQLSLSSLKLAITVIKSLFEFLQKLRYLDTDPWAAVPHLGESPAGIRTDHALTMDQMQFVLQYSKDHCSRRLHFILMLAYGTGMRLQELVDARLGDLKEYFDNVGGERCLILQVTGKGGRAREVLIPFEVEIALRECLAERTLNDAPLSLDDGERNPDAPLICGVDGRGPLTPSALYKTLKTFFAEAAAERAKTYPADAKWILAASTHWLRHTHITHAIARDVPIPTVQSNVGHADSATTSIYTHLERSQKVRHMRKFFTPSGEVPQENAPPPAAHMKGR